jgi:hypothetical protein
LRLATYKTSFEQRLVKTGVRLVKHARSYWLLLGDGHIDRRLYGQMLRRIEALQGRASSTLIGQIWS